MSVPLLEVRKLVLGVNGRTLVRDLDFRLCAGEVWCMLGPNGVGKSTFLHTAVGLRAQGYEVIAAGDACLSRREDDRQAGFTWMRSVGATVLPSETLLFGWLGRAGGPLFKAISRRIR